MIVGMILSRPCPGSSRQEAFRKTSSMVRSPDTKKRLTRNITSTDGFLKMLLIERKRGLNAKKNQVLSGVRPTTAHPQSERKKLSLDRPIRVGLDLVKMFENPWSSRPKRMGRLSTLSQEGKIALRIRALREFHRTIVETTAAHQINLEKGLATRKVVQTLETMINEATTINKATEIGGATASNRATVIDRATMIDRATASNRTTVIDRATMIRATAINRATVVDRAIMIRATMLNKAVTGPLGANKP